MARIIKEIELQGQRAVALDAIIGARTMEQWEIKVDPRTGGWIWKGYVGVNLPNSKTQSHLSRLTPHVQIV